MSAGGLFLRREGPRLICFPACCAVAPIAATRSNLVVLTSAQATKLVWAATSSSASLVTGSGVNFVFADGSSAAVYTAFATGEVILSAGTIQSPQLLELSGVGDPTIINPLGIDTVVDLPGVGANLQDHPTVINIYSLPDNFTSLDEPTGASAYEAYEEYVAGQGILTQMLSMLAYLPGSSSSASTTTPTRPRPQRPRRRSLSP